MAKIAYLSSIFIILPVLALAASPTLSFSVNPQNIDLGEATAISWFSQNTTYCVASGAWSGYLSTFGSADMFPNETSSYSISCTGPDGSVSDIKTVFVAGRPPRTTLPPTIITPTPQPIPTQPPQTTFAAACAASPTSAKIGDAFSFAAAQTGGWLPFAYKWGGDVSGNGQLITATFDTSGTKTARIKVIDAQNRIAEGSCAVVVTQAIVATPSPSPKPPPPVGGPPPTTVVAKTPTCQTVTICLDNKGNWVPKTGGSVNPVNGGDETQKVETAQNVNGRKFFLASLFGSGNGGNGQSRTRKVVTYLFPIAAALGIIFIGYLVFRFNKKPS